MNLGLQIQCSALEAALSAEKLGCRICIMFVIDFLLGTKVRPGVH
ncbi:MAG: hypothetical protein ABSF85_06440 [Terriglobales bacterium]|jgi:hypothetical protein